MLGRQRCQLSDEALTRLDQPRSRLRKPCVPDIECVGCLGVELAPNVPQERCSLTEDFLDLLGRSGRLGVDHRQRFVEEVPPVGRPRPDHTDVLWGEHRDAQGLMEVNPSAYHLSVHLGSCTPRGQDLGFDREHSVTHPSFSSEDGRWRATTYECLFRRAPERLERGQIGRRLEQAGLAGSVQTGDDGGSLRVELDDGALEVPKVSDSQ